MKTFMINLGILASAFAAANAGTLPGSRLSISRPASSIAPAASGSSGPIISTPTVPTPPGVPTGGFVVTGVYTTCLTLTFGPPTPTIEPPPPTPDPTDSAGGASLPVSSDPAESASLPAFTLSLMNPFSQPVSVDPIPTPSLDDEPPSDDSAIFTTCLVFLPTATVPGAPTETETTTTLSASGASGFSGSTFSSPLSSAAPSASQ